VIFPCEISGGIDQSIVRVINYNVFKEVKYSRAPLLFRSIHSLNADDVFADIGPSVVDPPDGETACISVVLVYRLTRAFEEGERVRTKLLFLFSQRGLKDGELMKEKSTLYTI
jgi:hypothetical protein